jgi:hypothetical protein
MHFHESLPVRGTLYLLVCAGILVRLSPTSASCSLTPSPSQVIPNLYKLVTSLHPPSLTSTGAKTAFYLLSAVPEWAVTTIYFSVDLNVLFGIRESRWKDKVEKKMKKGKWPAGIGYVGEEEYKRIDGSNYNEASAYSPSASYPPTAYNKV